MIRILPNADSSGAYFLEQPAYEVAELPATTQRRWRGRGSELLGLAGVVRPTDLTHVLQGRPPGTTLHPDPRRVRTGFDLVISAPKAVSILFASPDRQIAGIVVRAHEEAVGEMVRYLEQRAASVRREIDGERIELAIDGLIAAGFTHGLSRAGDPHLHTHLLIANLAHGEDGRFSALDTGGLQFHARAADALYQAHLRFELQRSLNLTFERSRDERIEVSGIGDAVLHAFSGRASEVAAGQRYSDEQRWSPSREEAVNRWRGKMARVEQFEDRPRSRVSPHLDEHRLAGALLGQSPRARDGLQALCEAAGPGLAAKTAVSFLTVLDHNLGRGVNEVPLAARSFLASPEHLRVLGPRPLKHRALARWRHEAERLDRQRDLYRDRPSISLDRSERHGSSR